MRSLGMNNFQQTGLYALTAESLSAGRNNIEVVKALLQADIKFIQYREKDKAMGLIYKECLVIRELTRQAKATFLLDDYVDIALAVNADGVHIGQDDLPPQVVRQLLGNDKIIGLSTHNMEQYSKAKALGIIDYVGVGPVFPTNTKKNVCAAVGLEYVKMVAQDAALPFVAIGGIKQHNIAAVAAAGAKTIAVVSDIVGAADISAKVNALKAAMNSSN